MVQKWWIIGRNHTVSFDLGWFPQLKGCSLLLSMALHPHSHKGKQHSMVCYVTELGSLLGVIKCLSDLGYLQFKMGSSWHSHVVSWGVSVLCGIRMGTANILAWSPSWRENIRSFTLMNDFFSLVDVLYQVEVIPTITTLLRVSPWTDFGFFFLHASTLTIDTNFFFSFASWVIEMLDYYDWFSNVNSLVYLE